MNMEERLVEFLVDKISPFYIILFGSTVKGTDTKNSDIDVAFLSKEKIDTYHVFMLGQELASELNRDIDLIDLNQATTVFQAQIVHTGKLIYCSDKGEKAKFELIALKKYAKLNEERLPILQNIAESGSIYEK